MKSNKKLLKSLLLTITGACIGSCVGISGYASQAQAGQLKNLIYNGDFSLDPLANPNDPTKANPYITGWINSTQNDLFYTNYLENFTVDNADKGSLGVRLGASPGYYTYIAQNFYTDVGQKYRLTYYLANIDDEFGNSLKVYAGEQLIDEKTNLPFSSPYVKQTVDFTATAGLTQLKFASQQQKAWWNIDNVSVVELENDNQQSTSVPEPSVMVGVAALGLIGFRTKRNRLAKS
ncbi:DUF642 domain-containing protein [Nostoc sp. MS1]|uniref:DUF642 domain-containing protein n=1 Tax=Nostoc sp. MS1 TaxID=2764711 RepID=UPI001CC6EDAB|nr:DUF642 domain-containing protein [Nostoc sp. MS1]BCL39017.1 hypothetical protein NSMS1_54640 [Nostoc sp. MS1]